MTAPKLAADVLPAFSALVDLRVKYECHVAVAEAPGGGTTLPDGTLLPSIRGGGGGKKAAAALDADVSAALARYEQYARHASSQLTHLQQRCAALEAELDKRPSA